MGGLFSKKKPIPGNNNNNSGTNTSTGGTVVTVPINRPIGRELPEVPRPHIPVPKPKLVYRALHDFAILNKDDLAFKKGDRLEIETESQNQDWWLARNLRTNKTGYAPSNYLCEDDSAKPQSQPWWFDVTRKEAEKLLMAPGCKAGTFLIRSSSQQGAYGLSVRDNDIPKETAVKHYKICPLDNGGFYISPKRQFKDLFELVENYKHCADGLCTKLIKPCKKTAPLPNITDVEIARSAITTSKKLGAGFFGDVFKGRYGKIMDVAVKSLKPGTMTSEEFLAEAKIMHTLRHDRLVRLIGVCSEDEPILIITELMENGALLDFLRKDEGKLVKFPKIVDMASEISEGMAFLETKNYIHRDLRAANILVDSNLRVKVADFGLARCVPEEEEIYDAKETTKFPVKWTAPEAVAKRQFSTKSDVWSFGILLYELVTFGRVPYPGMTGREVIEVIDNGYRMPKPDGPIIFPDSYYEKMVECWHKMPESRPTFDHLCDFFVSFDIATENQYNEGI